MTLFANLRLYSHRFTKAQERIAEFIQEYTQEAVAMPIHKLAKVCQVGDATVIRFYQLLGYESYPMFRIALAKEVSENKIQPIYEEVQSEDKLPEVIHKVIESTIQGVSELEGQLQIAVLEEMVERFCQAKVIHVIGLGASGVVAQDAMHKLMRLGLKINVYTDSHLMMIAAAVAQDDEVFFAISHSGETTDILRPLKVAKEQGCYTCALTSYVESSITKLVNSYLLTCTRDSKMRSESMVSRIVQLVVIDILYVRIALRFGDSALERVNQSRLELTAYRRSTGH